MCVYECVSVCERAESSLRFSFICRYCVCERERERGVCVRERESGGEGERKIERDRGRESERGEGAPEVEHFDDL